MKKYILIIVAFFSTTFAQAQEKRVKVPDEDLYFTYYYKIKKPWDFTKNDSVAYSWRVISPDSFYLDKRVHQQKVWTKVYVIEPQVDSVNVLYRMNFEKPRLKKVAYHTARLVPQHD
ncbi:hypothetical protein [Chitinophaga sp.]|uniref:hypothetical protein n=1 Tax=Chitinophaga sp. TaxID=1869181 RepID=UPI0031E06931